MKINEYQELAMRTNDGKCLERLYRKAYDNVIGTHKENIGEIVNACLGLSGEVGEVNDIVKKYIFHGHDIEINDLVKEISDCMWYIALMCQGLGIDMGEVARINIEKLKKRYPNGFSEQASINRAE